MKKLTTLLIALAISTAHAQETQGTGEAAAVSAKVAKQETYWQNWVFGSILLCTATAAIVIVALDSGSPASGH